MGRVEVYPKLDGRNMTMVLAPDKRAQAARAAERKRETEGQSTNGTEPATAPAAEAVEAPNPTAADPGSTAEPEVILDPAPVEATAEADAPEAQVPGD